MGSTERMKTDVERTSEKRTMRRYWRGTVQRRHEKSTPGLVQRRCERGMKSTR